MWHDCCLKPGTMVTSIRLVHRPRRLRLVQIPRRFVTDRWGGTETLVLETSRTLLAQGHHVEVYTTRALSDVAEDLVGGVRVRRFAHFYPYLGLSARHRAELDLKGGNPFSVDLWRALRTTPDLDLIHLHTGKRLGGIARHVARARGIPYVITLNGGTYDVPACEKEDLARPARGALEWGKVLGWWVGSRRVLDDASAIVCVGRREHELVQERHPHQRTIYLPNGVDCARFGSGDGAAFRRTHGIAPDAGVVLCVGRIDPQKNQLALVRQLPRWLAAVPSTRLVLVGPATAAGYLERVEETARELGVSGALTIVTGLGPTSQQVVDAYHAADVFALPSLHEPFGIVILEAWAAGLPVVAANVGGVPGFVRHGADALLADPTDDGAFSVAVLRLLVERERADELAQAARSRCRREFSWTSCVERLVELYEEVTRAHLVRA